MTDNRYYLIENRQYVGYDATLAQGPYNFSEAVTRPNWVEFFTFQDGMLVWLVDPTARRQQHLGAPGLRLRPAGRRDAELVHVRRRHEPDQPA